MELEKICQKNVVIAMTGNSLEEAARLMRENHVGDLVVVEIQGKIRVPIGLLTDRDIVMATLALGAPPHPFTVGDVMSTNLITVDENESIDHAIELMKENGVKRIPIVGKGAELRGIISAEDIMFYLTHELAELSKVSKLQRKIEQQRRRKFY